MTSITLNQGIGTFTSSILTLYEKRSFTPCDFYCSRPKCTAISIFCGLRWANCWADGSDQIQWEANLFEASVVRFVLDADLLCFYII